VTNELHQLAHRIPDDLAELERVLNRVYDGWKVGKHSRDDYHLDSVALNLHGFYSGLERIFERVAATVDGVKPKGENWHKALLQQVSNEVPGVRPAVITQETCERLEEYLGFRHIVRNVYVFKFDPNRIENLVMKVGPLFAQIREELLAFAKFLDEQEKRRS
jgi:hypothetical protein